MELQEWGAVLIDGFWRSAPVGGEQWARADWRVCVGRGRAGALAAVKRAKSSNEFRAAHPNKRERDYNCGNTSPAGGSRVLRNTQIRPSPGPDNQGRVISVLNVKPETAVTSEQARRTHPDWQCVGHPVSVKIGSNFVDVARAMTQTDDLPTIAQALHRLIYAGICTMPPAHQDALRKGGF